MSQLMNASCAIQNLSCCYLYVPLWCSKRTNIFLDSLQKCFYSKKFQTLSPLQIKHYCNVLGVPINASEAKIKQSFYKKSMIYHPDKNKGGESSQHFNELSEAYQALINYKRHVQQHDINTNTPPWQKSDHRPVRTFHQQKTATYSNKPSGSKDKEQFTHNHQFEEYPSTPHSSKYQSNASDWCSKFYINQLKKDFKQHQETKLKKELKPKEDDSCNIM